MTLPAWSVLLLLALAAAALALRRLPPRQVLAVLLFAAAGGLALLRQFVLAVAMAGIAVKLWRDGARMTPPAPGGRSEVESAALRMTLDHASGTLDGEITAGPFAGRRLSGLSAEELRQLYEAFEAAGDHDSLSLLLAWLDRSGKPRAEPPPTDRPMTEAEAYRVLGLAPGASIDEVRAAYRRLMKRVHPDLGGSGALAAMLNEAKQVLDPG